jgi:hypothetical protein
LRVEPEVDRARYPTISALPAEPQTPYASWCRGGETQMAAEFPKVAFVYGRRVAFTVSQDGAQWAAFGQFDGQELRVDDAVGPNAAVALWICEARRLWRKRQGPG